MNSITLDSMAFDNFEIADINDLSVSKADGIGGAITEAASLGLAGLNVNTFGKWI